MAGTNKRSAPKSAPKLAMKGMAPAAELAQAIRTTVREVSLMEDLGAKDMSRRIVAKVNVAVSPDPFSPRGTVTCLGFGENPMQALTSLADIVAENAPYQGVDLPIMSDPKPDGAAPDSPGLTSDQAVIRGALLSLQTDAIKRIMDEAWLRVLEASPHDDADGGWAVRFRSTDMANPYERWRHITAKQVRDCLRTVARREGRGPIVEYTTVAGACGATIQATKSRGNITGVGCDATAALVDLLRRMGVGSPPVAGRNSGRGGGPREGASGGPGRPSGGGGGSGGPRGASAASGGLERPGAAEAEEVDPGDDPRYDEDALDGSEPDMVDEHSGEDGEGWEE